VPLCLLPIFHVGVGRQTSFRFFFFLIYSDFPHTYALLLLPLWLNSLLIVGTLPYSTVLSQLPQLLISHNVLLDPTFSQRHEGTFSACTPMSEGTRASQLPLQHCQPPMSIFQLLLTAALLSAAEHES
jgi:hypothetical protein